MIQISTIAKKLSVFARINKLQKEKVGIKSLLESIIDEYINHPLYDKIEFPHSNVMMSEVEPSSKEPSFDSAQDDRNPTDKSQDDIFVDIDVTQFKSAFENLLNNALEAIDENGYVKINVKKEKDEVIIEMRNSVSQDSTPTSFEVESCLERGFSTKGSSGLGVPIAKTIIEKHGGTFKIEKVEREFIVKIILILKDVK
ncbi:MAG TPA: ATP-binding protein [Candidatus Cloacimonetes bacterium]|nr:ATP-binding protein [Candidatus Cloacimonadota bacterium]